jgi:RNA polymerase sigma-70 factor (ECF subfamily)
MDKEDFSLRITSAQGRMYRVARSYLRGEHDRLDAISEAILRAWQKRGSLRKEEFFEPWLIKILTRECVNIQRRQKRMVPVEELPRGGEETLPSDNEALREALEALPQKLRTVTVLYYMEGYPVYEAAQALGITKGAVCSRLSRARGLLRELLKEEIE